MTGPANNPDVGLGSLSIRDFRGIERLDLDFRGPDRRPNRLVVLAGPNGSGKTAALEAGLLACGGHALMTGARGRKAIRRGADTYEIVAHIERGPDGLNVIDTPFQGPPEHLPPIPHWYFSSWRATRLVGPVDVSLGRPGRKSARTDVNRLKNIKESLVNAAAADRFRPAQGTLFPSPRRPRAGAFPRWIDSINSAWRDFYPDSGQSFLVDLVDSDWEDRGTFDVFLDVQGRSRIEVDRLSAGQLEIFLFLAALVLNDDRDGVIFIDEPELHLDPQWHRAIVRSLMRLQPRAQFIVATHSPEIYDAARSYERHFLVPDDDPRAHLWGDTRQISTGV